MQNIYYQVNDLDQNCYKNLHLSEDVLMENAAIALKNFISKKFKPQSSVLIIAGPGNNGADGIALARMLYGNYQLALILAEQPKSKMAKIQLKRALAVGVKQQSKITDCDLIVDSIFGSGFNGKLPDKVTSILKQLNQAKAFKLACDMPSGIDQKGNCAKHSFKADCTITMGAAKLALFADNAKDLVGKIKVADLGVSSKVYQPKSNLMLLEASDLKLPLRQQQNTNKGSFGHLAVLAGNKTGAASLAGLAALRFGVGLVTIIDKNNNNPELMSNEKLPSNTSAIAFGMGLAKISNSKRLFNSKGILSKIIASKLPKIIDADMFYHPKIATILKQDNIVITPHAKEFAYLLKILNIADLSISKLQNNRFKYAQIFCNKYPKTTLVLKGANTIICHKKKMFINPLGTNALSKGGSGDVLSGLIGALLAQGHSPISAACNASLAHSISAGNAKINNYALTPLDIIEGLKKLV